MAIVLLLLIAGWAIAVAVTGRAVAASLYESRASLTAAQDAIDERDLDALRRAVTAATSQASDAAQRLRSAHIAPLRWLPVAGPNLTAVGAIAEGVRDVGGAVETLAGMLDAGSDDDEANTLRRFVDLGEPIRELATTFSRTTSAVEAAGSPTLLPAVADARADYLELAGPITDQLDVVADLAEQLPVLLGYDRPRTYLVGAASLSELRGSGGLLGSFALLTVDAGGLDFGPFVGIDDVEPATAGTDVPAPSSDYADRYRHLGGLRFWRNANLSFDFSAGARVLLDLWERDGGAPLDGVVVADTVAFEHLVEHAGSIEIPGVTTLTADTTRKFVGLDAYDVFDNHEERKLVLGSIAAATFLSVAELIDGDDVLGMLEVLGASMSGGHLKVFSTEPAVAAALARVGATGEPVDDPGEFAAVVVNNVAGNKVDFFTERAVEHRVELVAGGGARAVVTASFTNTAPSDGYSSYVLGPQVDGAQAGDNLSLVTFLCGLDCEVTEAPEGAQANGRDRGHPASDLWLTIPRAATRTVTWSTATDDAWRDVDGTAELVVRHHRQATVASSDLRVVVSVPAGFAVVQVPEDAQVRGDVVVWESDEGTANVVLTYRFAPVDATP